jgi:hypothetical protein
MSYFDVSGGQPTLVQGCRHQRAVTTGIGEAQQIVKGAHPAADQQRDTRRGAA